MKIKIDFTLPEFSETKIVVWKCHVYYFAKCGWDMILGRYLLTSLVLNLNTSKHLIEAGDGYLKVSMEPMIYLGTY